MNNLYLAHHGIKGQKWGVRRFQNEDGTWTKEGRARRYKIREAKAIGAGVAVGGALGAIGLMAGNPMAVGGSAAAGMAAYEGAYGLMNYKYEHMRDREGTKQTKKLNKKRMRDPDYLTELKDHSSWMPSSAKESLRDGNDYYRQVTKNNKELQKFMKDNYGDSPEQMKNHLKKSVKGLNEASESESPYSGDLFTKGLYNNATNAYAKGFIDSKTFDTFYEASTTHNVASMLQEYDVSQPHYRKDLKSIIDEGDRLYSQNKKNGVGRLDNWFSEDPDMNPEKKMKHFYYSVNELYA